MVGKLWRRMFPRDAAKLRHIVTLESVLTVNTPLGVATMHKGETACGAVAIEINLDGMQGEAIDISPVDERKGN